MQAQPGLAPKNLVLLVLALAGSSGCERENRTAHAHVQAEPAAAPAAAAADDRLPEDPEAGKRSELQWREHLAEEEHERQLGFDRRRLSEHRAVVSLLIKARARYDEAGSERVLAARRGENRKRCAELRRRVQHLDPWGVNSRLLADYAALGAALETAYPDARQQALSGDGAALQEVGLVFDQHMATIRQWLTEAAEEEDDEEH